MSIAGPLPSTPGRQASPSTPTRRTARATRRARRTTTNTSTYSATDYSMYATGYPYQPSQTYQYSHPGTTAYAVPAPTHNLPAPGGRSYASVVRGTTTISYRAAHPPYKFPGPSTPTSAQNYATKATTYHATMACYHARKSPNTYDMPTPPHKAKASTAMHPSHSLASSPPSPPALYPVRAWTPTPADGLVGVGSPWTSTSLHSAGMGAKEADSDRHSFDGPALPRRASVPTEQTCRMQRSLSV